MIDILKKKKKTLEVNPKENLDELLVSDLEKQFWKENKRFWWKKQIEAYNIISFVPCISGISEIRLCHCMHQFFPFHHWILCCSLEVPHFLIHSPFKRYLRCFQPVATMYKAALNRVLCAYVFAFLLGKYLGVGCWVVC